MHIHVVLNNQDINSYPVLQFMKTIMEPTRCVRVIEDQSKKLHTFGQTLNIKFVAPTQSDQCWNALELLY